MSSALLDPLFGADRVNARLDEAAWVAALIAVEVALAHATADEGLVPKAHAELIEAAAATVQIDTAALGRAAVAGGNPVIPLVRLLRQAAGEAGPSVHHGATSQDVMDTAAVLLTGWAGEVVLDDLLGAADAAAALAAAHRDTPMIARTLGQQAVPTTFGLVAAGWAAGLDRARTGLATVLSGLPAQCGGAAGTLAALHPHGLAVATSLARRLALAEAALPWHTERSRIGEVAGALAVAAGACAKPATDVVLLAGTELGEVSEAAPGTRRPCPTSATRSPPITARAAARRVPGAGRDPVRGGRPRAPAGRGGLAHRMADADRPARGDRWGGGAAPGLAHRSDRAPPSGWPPTCPTPSPMARVRPAAATPPSWWTASLADRTGFVAAGSPSAG
jgi:3-carboxy-cis,cis-muconate cycloisomerase